MIPASSTRWKAAQDAERKAFHSWKLEESTTYDQFFFQNFLVDSEFFTGKNVLEVGCSPAAAIHSLRRACLKVGIDPLAVEWGRFYRDSTHHIQGMGEFLPFKDETFDVVLCINVLDHVQNPSTVLKEILRCLRKRGALVLWLQTFSTRGMISRVLNLIDSPHPHHFDDDDISSMLKEIGYGVDHYKHMRVRLQQAISVIQGKLIISGLKSLFANLFLGPCESSYLCSKAVQNPRRESRGEIEEKAEMKLILQSSPPKKREVN